MNHFYFNQFVGILQWVLFSQLILPSQIAILLLIRINFHSFIIQKHLQHAHNMNQLLSLIFLFTFISYIGAFYGEPPSDTYEPIIGSIYPDDNFTILEYSPDSKFIVGVKYKQPAYFYVYSDYFSRYQKVFIQSDETQSASISFVRFDQTGQFILIASGHSLFGFLFDKSKVVQPYKYRYNISASSQIQRQQEMRFQMFSDQGKFTNKDHQLYENLGEFNKNTTNKQSSDESTITAIKVLKQNTILLGVLSKVYWLVFPTIGKYQFDLINTISFLNDQKMTYTMHQHHVLQKIIGFSFVTQNTVIPLMWYDLTQGKIIGRAYFEYGTREFILFPNAAYALQITSEYALKLYDISSIFEPLQLWSWTQQKVYEHLQLSSNGKYFSVNIMSQGSCQLIYAWRITFNNMQQTSEQNSQVYFNLSFNDSPITIKNMLSGAYSSLQVMNSPGSQIINIYLEQSSYRLKAMIWSICSERYYFDNDTCQLCNEKCKYCKGSSDYCIGCANNTYVEQNFNCYVCSETVHNCIECSTRSSCKICDIGFFVRQEDGLCQYCRGVLQNCQQCDQKSKCNMCDFNFTINTEGKCQCKEHYYSILNSSTFIKTCLLCNQAVSNCNSCILYKGIIQCLKCQDDFVISDDLRSCVKRQEQASLWIYIGGAAVLFVVILIIIIILCFKRKQSKAQSKQPLLSEQSIISDQRIAKNQINDNFDEKLINDNFDENRNSLQKQNNQKGSISSSINSIKALDDALFQRYISKKAVKNKHNYK